MVPRFLGGTTETYESEIFSDLGLVVRGIKPANKRLKRRCLREGTRRGNPMVHNLALQYLFDMCIMGARAKRNSFTSLY